MRHLTKKPLAIALALVLLLGLAVPAFAFDAQTSPQGLTVDGKTVACEKYNIDGRNYFMLRDLAALLNGTPSQFNVAYDAERNAVVVTKGEAYTPDGTELHAGVDNSASTVASPQTVYIDGEQAELTAYNIGGHNFFQLRELGKTLGFYVHYDAATNTASVDASDEDEAWDTGDASKDDPRNADGIGEKELLVVSFGTSFNDSRVATIGAIENALEKAFPGYSVRRGFTANIIIDHVYKRDDEKIDDITEALDRAVANGVKELVVQPTHLMHGFEYDDVIAELAKYSDVMDIKVAEPLLTSDADYDAVIKAITEGTKEYLDGETAICFMGHGTEHEYNFVYSRMQEKLTEQGYKDYFVGTVEATPTFREVVDAVKAAGYKKVVLEPLMIVAGDHANNDMADPEDPESWYSMFAAAGIEPTVVLKGLGEFEAVQNLFVEHTKAVMPAAEEAVAPASRDMASKTDTRKPIVEEGMAAVAGDKLADGTYAVKVMHNGMFAVEEDATLTVKDGKMTAVITMSSGSQNWMFVGDKEALASAADSDLIPLTDSTFTLPVEALDAEIVICSYSKNRDAWYERGLLFRADSLPEEAFTETLGTDPASLNLADGAYTVEVALAGGSGKTSVTSPAKLVVKDGKLTASVVFSSSKYDWVKLGETQYDVVTTDPSSTFELPVAKLDSNIAIIGHTTAMGGQEISYTLNFDSASIKAAE